MPAPIEMLLVEDSPGDVWLAQEALKDLKLRNEVHVVSDGESALAYLRGEGAFAGRRRPDLVLLDLNLPRVTGIEVLEAMQRDPDLREIAVVVLTVTDTDRHLLNSYDVLTSCCVVKPLTPERYLEAVRCYPQFGIAITRVAAEQSELLD